jgi:hypothetical protein
LCLFFKKIKIIRRKEGDAQKVKILRAWEVDPNWKERAWEQKQTPSVFQSIRDYFLEE